jgi:hypothetical protein
MVQPAETWQPVYDDRKAEIPDDEMQDPIEEEKEEAGQEKQEDQNS